MIVESTNQFKFACVLFSGGGLAGLLCDLIFGLFFALSLKKLGRISLVSYYFIATFLFINLSKFFEMTSLRLYMPIIFILGSIIYYKSFHKFVAFLYNFCYTKFRKFLESLQKRKSYGRAKNKKGNIGKRSNRRVLVDDFAIVYDLPNANDRRKKAYARRKPRKDRTIKA